MTVQELIDYLEKVEDKEKKILIERPIFGYDGECIGYENTDSVEISIEYNGVLIGN